jgi:hypothetical protein
MPGREPVATPVKKTAVAGKKKTVGKGTAKKSASKKAPSGKKAAISIKGAAKKRTKKAKRRASKH